MFYLGGVGLAFFLFLLLLSKSRKTFADNILAGWLLVITAHLLLFYFRKTWLYPQLLGIEIPLPLVHGPFLYLYTRALTDRRLSPGVSLLHYVPSLAVLLYIIPFFALSQEQKLFVYQHNGAGYETFSQIKVYLIIASGVLYVTLSGISLKKHRAAIANQFSSIEKINLLWLQYLIYWIGTIWILVIFANDDWIYSATVFFVLFIGFFGIRQVRIFITPEVISREKENATRDEMENDPANRPKYQKSGLSADSSESLHQDLSLIMSNEKLFRESELSLSELARRLNAPPNYLSQVINEREGKNFYDYINSMRIEEFKRLATGPDSRKYTLLALAQECGFNSKSSFNRYFKKVTGKSPSEFVQTVSDSGN